MDLERERLERIDRRRLAPLGEDEAFQMVRVLVTAAKWATWKRYCETAGTSMGRAIAALIDRELGLVDGSDDDHQPASTCDRQERRAVREDELNARNVYSPLREIGSTPRPNARRVSRRVGTVEYDLEMRSRLAAQRMPGTDS